MPNPCHSTQEVTSSSLVPPIIAPILSAPQVMGEASFPYMKDPDGIPVEFLAFYQ